MDQSHYYQYYIDGNAARKLEQRPRRQPARPRTKLPVAQEQPKRVRTLVIEPVAVIALAAAVVLAVLMLVSVTELRAANRQVVQLEISTQYALDRVNALRDVYQAGYDPAAVKIAANSKGMIPVSEAEHTVFRLPAPEQEEAPEPTWWERFVAFFSDESA